MRSATGKIGRVFILRFEHGDVVLREIERFCRQKKVATGVCLFIGALKKGDLAAGPRRPVIPPEPNWVSFRDGWETMGIATVFPGKKGPQVHVHSAMGRKNRVLAGCVRKESEVFLVLEAVLFEVSGCRARKEMDPRTGINLLSVG